MATPKPRPPLLPEDPRHGTPAGAQAHVKAGQKPCGPCAGARYRSTKRYKHHAKAVGPNRAPAGDDIYRIVTASTPLRIATESGVSRRTILRIARGGPETEITRRTRHALHNRQPTWTPLGIQRRVQALCAIGYPVVFIAEHASVSECSVGRIARANTRIFIRANIADAIIATYNELHMTPAFMPVSSAAARQNARRHGWRAPLDWDHLDTDVECAPAVTEEDPIDEVKVERVLAGWLEDCNIAERYAVIERWDGSQAELQRRTGWHIHRMINQKKVA